MSSRRTHQHGYTLLELLLTVSIVTIITSIALPSYQNHVRRSHRGDAMAALMRIANAQEKWYLQNNTYSSSLTDLEVENTQNGYYTLSVDSADVDGFTASATAKSGGPQEGDDTCQSFSIDATGALGAESEGGSDTTVQCWR